MNETKMRRTEITIETHSLMTIRTRGDQRGFHFCQSCGENVSVFAPAHAAFMFRVREQFLAELFDAQKIHEVDETALCGNSLINYFK